MSEDQEGNSSTGLQTATEWRKEFERKDLVDPDQIVHKTAVIDTPILNVLNDQAHITARPSPAIARGAFARPLRAT